MKNKATIQLEMIGLGRMGSNTVRRLLRSGYYCVVFNRSPQTIKDLVKEKAIGSSSLADLLTKLNKPRAVWLMVLAAANALYERSSSRGQADYQNKVVSAMRLQFGGHQKKPAI